MKAIARAISAARHALRRHAAYTRMRAFEDSLRSACETLPYVTDDLARNAMRNNIQMLSRELCRARADYQSFLPPGERIVFNIA